MKYWPEISFRCADRDSSLKQRGKVNLFPEQTESGGAENFARCTRVLRKLDSCPGEKSLTSLSTMQNPSTVSRHCNTREPSWAEDFIDLTEFCQPSTIPIKMEDSVDECTASPITNNNTVNAHHGFDYALEVNELDSNIDDTLWRMSSPAMAMQEELCDPLTDWLSVTKETNNNNHNINHNINHNHHHHHHSGGHVNNIDNLSLRSEISYDISDALLNSSLMSVPNSSQAYNKKPANFIATNEVVTSSHQLQSDSMYYPNESLFGDVRNHSTSTESLMLSRPETSTRLSSANSLFIDSGQTEPVTMPTPTTYGVPSHNQFLSMKSSTPLTNVSTVSSMEVQTPCAVQAPSATTPSNPSVPGGEVSSRGMPIRQNVKLKLNVNLNTPVTNSSCTIQTPEMLQPLVAKNSGFDLVSYVFDEHNKPPAPLDVPSLSQQSTGAANIQAVQNECRVSQIDHSDSGKRTPSVVTIKTEPKDEVIDEEQCSTKGHGHLHSKHRRDSKDEEDSCRAKRLRRYSNCSSEDLTQLESEKYRELRNKNNEASRRSRANRKSREVEMREHALKLEGENKRLKMKAEEMEKLVKRLRNCLMQLVLKRR